MRPEQRTRSPCRLPSHRWKGGSAHIHHDVMCLRQGWLDITPDHSKSRDKDKRQEYGFPFIPPRKLCFLRAMEESPGV